jgi:hypothetical protein
MSVCTGGSGVVERLTDTNPCHQVLHITTDSKYNIVISANDRSDTYI